MCVSYISTFQYLSYIGAVVKVVITPACHAGGRGFESLPLRQLFQFHLSVIL